MLGKGLESLIPPKQNNDSAGKTKKSDDDSIKLKDENTSSDFDFKDNVAAVSISPVTPINHIHPNLNSSSASNFRSPRFPRTEAGINQRKSAIGDAIFHIEVEKIKPNPFQPRKHFNEDSLRDLADSIREVGILQPLVVSKIDKDTETGTDVEYQLIVGERRLMAAKLLGLERVPVIIRQPENKEEQLEMAIIENIQRENLDLIETARAYARLQDEFRLTQREIAAKVGKSREAISNTLRLLGLSNEIQQAISQGKISESHARLLLTITNPDLQKQLFEDLLKNILTVRQLKYRAHKIQNPEKDFKMPSDEEFELEELEKRLKDFLGTDVKIDKKGEGGKIIISFYSSEEIYGIVSKIKPNSEEY